MRPLEGKVALVSGSGRGIGRAIALKLASAGARLVVNDLDAGVAEDTAESIREAGGEAVTVPGDVTAADFGTRFVQAGVDAFGSIDIIVNNAGYAWDAILQKTSDEQFEAMLAVHLTAPFRILRAAQPVISAATKAEAAAGQTPARRSVVNITSIAAMGGNVGQSGYASGKAGVIGLTKTIAKEWGRLGVTVNAVAFGIVDTRMTGLGTGRAKVDVGGREIDVGMGEDLQAALTTSIPLGRPGTIDDAAGAVYLLCLEEAAYITGTVLECTGGFSL
jgi:3-oxoacyl-[acyl-carrier protein] reductase